MTKPIKCVDCEHLDEHGRACAHKDVRGPLGGGYKILSPVDWPQPDWCPLRKDEPELRARKERYLRWLWEHRGERWCPEGLSADYVTRDIARATGLTESEVGRWNFHLAPRGELWCWQYGKPGRQGYGVNEHEVVDAAVDLGIDLGLVPFVGVEAQPKATGR